MQRRAQRIEVLAGHDRDRKDRRVLGDRSAQALADFGAGLGDARHPNQIDLRRYDQHAAHVEKLQDREMLERLRHNAFVDIHDEQQQLHAGSTGEHVVQEFLVARHVDDSGLDAVVEAQVREAEIERHAALAFLGPAVGVRSRQGLDQRRLPVIDVPRRPDDVHALLYPTARMR